MTATLHPQPDICAAGSWEFFAHGADVGIRGRGRTLEEAFEQAAVALTSIMVDPSRVRPTGRVDLSCEARGPELLLVGWLNALVLEMSAHHRVFSRFQVKTSGTRLYGSAWGEEIDPARHDPGAEVKGATLTELTVRRDEGTGRWLAQCVVDV
jgi:tRNA nucleotidyltransferase (CCA-adding enzyme)